MRQVLGTENAYEISRLMPVMPFGSQPESCNGSGWMVRGGFGAGGPADHGGGLTLSASAATEPR